MKNLEIEIHRLGPIENAKVCFSKMMILTGESSLGKSYLNYVLYYLMKSFQPQRFGSFFNKYLKESEKEQAFIFKRSDIEKWLHDGLQDYLRSFLGDDNLVCDVDFSLKGLKENISFRYKCEQIFDGQNDTYQSQPTYKISYEYNYEPLKSWQVHEIRGTAVVGLLFGICRDLFGTLYSQVVILPPGRGAFVGENFTVKNNISSSMEMYNEFFTQYDRATLPQGEVDKTDKTIIMMMQSLINGRLITEKDKQYFILQDGGKISLAAAASSIKEVSPLLFLIKNRSAYISSVCMEEPEAHLHPAMQAKVADLIASYFNEGNFFQITTHSDYFLSRLNHLIKLGAIKKKNEKKFKALCQQLNIPEMAVLDKEMIGAYFFERDNAGRVRVQPLDVSDHGIPFSTFYKVVMQQQQDDETLEKELFELEEGE